MIRYALTCEAGHGFDSWFKSAEGFENLLSAGLVSCAVCGSGKVQKALMAPSVRPARDAAETAPASADAVPGPAAGPLGAPRSALEEAFAALRREVEENSEYVGLNFAAEARRIHSGDAPGRAIYGEARPEEARALLEDGVPVAPLPFLPRRKAN